MGKAIVRSFNWSSKIQVEQKKAYAIGLLAVLGFTFIKIRPYFEEKPVYKVFVNGKDPKTDSKKPPPGNGQVPPGPRLGTAFDNLLAQRLKGLGGASATSSKPKNFVIERPLFDGAMVTLKAVLMESISSNAGSAGIRARLIDGGDLGGSYEVSFLKDAILSGAGSAYFDSKLYTMQFSSLLTPEGKDYAVTAFAFDEGKQMVGVPANYSSGLPARIAGAVISQAIQVGQDVGTARVLNNTGTGDSVATMEMSQALISTSQQASGDIGTESTSTLRGTKAELSLPAGTIFTVKLKALSNNSGGAR